MKLYRSNTDKKLTGLCGGLAESFKIDATILRLLVAIGVVFSGGAVLLLYLLAALVIPKEPGPYQTTYNYGGQTGGWHYGQTPGQGPSGTQQTPYHSQSNANQTQSSTNPIDDMMKDIEKKALLKEIEDLKARLAKIEKNEKGEE